MSLKIVIVGGVAGGMSAATRARRMNESADITVFEKSGYVSFANCGLPYYVGGEIADEARLLITTPPRLAERYRIDARVHHEVTAIDRTRKVVTVRDHAAGRTFQQAYDKLILAPGAAPIVPDIEHIRAPNVFLMRSMEDTRALYRWLDERRPASAAVIGAGFIGLEMTEALRRRGLAVTLIEKASHAMPLLDREMAGWLHAELQTHQVRLLVGTGLAALEARAGRVTAVKTEDGETVAADLVVLSIGVRPNVELARAAGLVIGAGGAIAVDEYQRTSDGDIYAVGDAAEVTHQVTGQRGRVPLAGPANRHGRAAGEHAATGSAPPAGAVLGSSIVRVFDLAVGLTGLSEAQARRMGLNVDAAYVLPGHHAGFYPGADQLRLKLIYQRANGRIVGAQALGAQGVDKRIDVIATAMHFGGTTDDLEALDLAYAPQFGSAKDPIHLAGFVAHNQRRGLMPAIAPEQRDGQLPLDVRSASEFAAGALEGAINISLDQLRRRLGELPRDRDILIYCAVGQRGYVAQRILQQHGFTRVQNLKGGYALATAHPRLHPPATS